MVEKDTLTIILGNQLFDYKYYKDKSKDIFMCEDFELATHFKYHKHKIMHFFISMREYRDYISKKGKNVIYGEFSKETSFFNLLKDCLKKHQIKKIELYEVEDLFFEQKIIDFCKNEDIKITFIKSPMFICSRKEFKDYLETVKKPFMNSFYIAQRKKLNILIDKNKPIGGKWSFDDQNRKKIPKKFKVNTFIPNKNKSKYFSSIEKIVNKYFLDHPGETTNFWIPTNRTDSIAWFKSYLDDRFVHFGDFQDAIDTRAPFLYHSVISPMMNIGFILPEEIIKEVLQHKNDDNLNSVEGFIRQVIGWRDFLRGIYQNYDQIQQESNFFDHHGKLTHHWYNGTTGIPPVDDAILKSIEWGYCHHIERLMVIGNIMLMLEVHPQEVYRWFMEMFVDSSDWVMGPNVFGMSQFSDGGIFATKPYISGSNYLLKMSHYKKDEAWCDAVDGLYWGFIDHNQEFFRKNHRMSMMVSRLSKMDKAKKEKIFLAANTLKKRITK